MSATLFPADLESRVAALDAHHRLAFALAMAERAFPVYEESLMHAYGGDESAARALLDAGWEAVMTGELVPLSVDDDVIMPDLDPYEQDHHESVALHAATMILTVKDLSVEDGTKPLVDQLRSLANLIDSRLDHLGIPGAGPVWERERGFLAADLSACEDASLGVRDLATGLQERLVVRNRDHGLTLFDLRDVAGDPGGE